MASNRDFFHRAFSPKKIEVRESSPTETATWKPYHGECGVQNRQEVPEATELVNGRSRLKRNDGSSCKKFSSRSIKLMDDLDPGS
jgi:hypothetical protein